MSSQRDHSWKPTTLGDVLKKSGLSADQELGEEAPPEIVPTIAESRVSILEKITTDDAQPYHLEISEDDSKDIAMTFMGSEDQIMAYFSGETSEQKIKREKALRTRKTLAKIEEILLRGKYRDKKRLDTSGKEAMKTISWGKCMEKIMMLMLAEQVQDGANLSKIVEQYIDSESQDSQERLQIKAEYMKRIKNMTIKSVLAVDQPTDYFGHIDAIMELQELIPAEGRIISKKKRKKLEKKGEVNKGQYARSLVGIDFTINPEKKRKDKMAYLTPQRGTFGEVLSQDYLRQYPDAVNEARVSIVRIWFLNELELAFRQELLKRCCSAIEETEQKKTVSAPVFSNIFDQLCVEHPNKNKNIKNSREMMVSILLDILGREKI